MIKILIGNSFSYITGLNTAQFRSLRLLLSYQVSDSAAFFGGAAALSSRRYLIGSRGGFPSGLLPLVNKWLKESGIVADVLEGRKRPFSTPGMFNLNLEDAA